MADQEVAAVTQVPDVASYVWPSGQVDTVEAGVRLQLHSAMPMAGTAARTRAVRVIFNVIFLSRSVWMTQG